MANDKHKNIYKLNAKLKLLNQPYRSKFGPTAQFVKNVGIVIKCCECNKWHVLYSKSKLSSFEISILERYLDTIQYPCGVSFEALANLMEIWEQMRI